LLQAIQIPESQLQDVILSVDKLEKIGIDGVRNDLMNREIQSETIDMLCKTLETCMSMPLSEFDKMFPNSLVKEGVTELQELRQYLVALGIQRNTTFSPFLARGLTMYTGTIYEIFLADGSITSSIGSGGRYDYIIGALRNDNKSYPTVGISFGLDVIYTALVQKERVSPSIDIFIIPLGTQENCLKIAHTLRTNESLKIELELANRKLKRALNYANKENIPYVLIIGEEEINNDVAVLRNMKEGTEQTIPLASIENGTFKQYIRR